MPKIQATTTRVFLRFRDMDELGHLTHSVYHDFFAEGRLALIGERLSATSTDLVLARVEVDYRHEVRHRNGYVDVLSHVDAVGRRSLSVGQIMILPDGTTAAESKSVMVVWDSAGRRSRELSARERTALSNSGT